MYAEQQGELLPMTEAEYLTFANGQEFKYEYRAGTVYAMTGSSVRHGVITMNAGTHISNQLTEHDCSVTSPDVRVHVAPKGTYRYPDVTVFCGDPEYVTERTDTITNPVLLVEVLSPSTALSDRNEKLEEYTQLHTLQAYVLVAQDDVKHLPQKIHSRVTFADVEGRPSTVTKHLEVGWRNIVRNCSCQNSPSWEIVYQQTQCWLRAGVFEAMVHDLRVLRRLTQGRNEQHLRLEAVPWPR